MLFSENKFDELYEKDRTADQKIYQPIESFEFDILYINCYTRACKVVLKILFLFFSCLWQVKYTFFLICLAVFSASILLPTTDESILLNYERVRHFTYMLKYYC